MSAADDHRQLQAQETVLLATAAKLDEQRDEVRRQLAGIRANLAGVKLGERLAAEAAAELAEAEAPRQPAVEEFWDSQGLSDSENP